jgi:hypothetical protein
MSAYPPKLTVEADIPDQTASSSFDHLVGAGEQPVGNLEAERFGGFEVDHKFILGRVLHRQVGWLLALEVQAT